MSQGSVAHFQFQVIPLTSYDSCHCLGSKTSHQRVLHTDLTQKQSPDSSTH